MKVTAKICLDLIDLVKRMRRAQRNYFSQRTAQALSESRDLERRVDGLLNEIAQGDVQGLFDGLQTLTPPTEVAR